MSVWGDISPDRDPEDDDPGTGDDDLMTRKQVAYLFRTTSVAVKAWARRGRLPEILNEEGRPRYRRGDVMALYRKLLASR